MTEIYVLYSCIFFCQLWRQSYILHFHDSLTFPGKASHFQKIPTTITSAPPSPPSSLSSISSPPQPQPPQSQPRQPPKNKTKQQYEEYSQHKGKADHENVKYNNNYTSYTNKNGQKCLKHTDYYMGYVKWQEAK